MTLKLNEKNIDKISHNLLVKMQAIYNSLKKAEKKAADLILDNPDLFLNATISEAAQKAGCSEATFTRLARKLGFNGYPDLRTQIINNSKEVSISMYENININDDSENIIKKVFNSSIQALQDTLNILDIDKYKKAVEILCNANKIVFYGVGDAAAVASSGYQKFLRLGIESYMSTDIDIELINISHLKKGDVFFAISYSGRTKSVIELSKYAKSQEAFIISITNFPFSPLAKYSDIVLLTANFTEHLEGEVMSKRISELCILESLYVDLLLKKYENLSESLKRANLAVEVNKIL